MVSLLPDAQFVGELVMYRVADRRCVYMCVDCGGVRLICNRRWDSHVLQVIRGWLNHLAFRVEDVDDFNTSYHELIDRR